MKRAAKKHTRDLQKSRRDFTTLKHLLNNGRYPTNLSASTLLLPIHVSQQEEDAKKKTIDGQMVFDSGWEWGYWLHDVIVARASWDPCTGEKPPVTREQRDLKAPKRKKGEKAPKSTPKHQKHQKHQNHQKHQQAHKRTQKAQHTASHRELLSRAQSRCVVLVVIVVT